MFVDTAVDGYCMAFHTLLIFALMSQLWCITASPTPSELLKMMVLVVILQQQPQPQHFITVITVAR